MWRLGCQKVKTARDNLPLAFFLGALEQEGSRRLELNARGRAGLPTQMNVSKEWKVLSVPELPSTDIDRVGLCQLLRHPCLSKDTNG